MPAVIEPVSDVTGEMSLGVAGDISALVEWRIPDFFSLDAVKGKYLDSPAFSVAGSAFFLRVYTNGLQEKGYLPFFLRMIDSETVPKKLSFHLGFKKVDGTLDEYSEALVHTFTQLESSYGYNLFNGRESLKRHVDEYALTLTCRVMGVALTPEVPKPEPQQIKQLVELESLSSDFGNLLTGEKKCDVTVTVQGKKFRAHRAILSARSSVFQAMFEHDTLEDQTGVLPISDCDPDTFGEFLGFLYTGQLEEVSFCTACQLYITADKYNVLQLKDFCAAYLTQNLSPENVTDVVILADKFDDDRLGSSAQDYFNKNFLKILLTSEWTTLMKNNYRLADKLQKGMATSVTKFP